MEFVVLLLVQHRLQTITALDEWETSVRNYLLDLVASHKKKSDLSSTLCGKVLSDLVKVHGLSANMKIYLANAREALRLVYKPKASAASGSADPVVAVEENPE